jgi:hypothetical protein
LAASDVQAAISFGTSMMSEILLDATIAIAASW